LPDDTRPSGAERRADGHLARPVHRPREEQVGDVRAGDQHHERHRAKQHEERRPDWPCDRIPKRYDSYLAGRIVGRVVASELRADAVEIGDCLSFGHSRLDSPEGFEVLATPARRRLGHVVADRRPDLGGRVEARGDQRFVLGRHHANDLKRDVVHRNRAADDRRIGAKPPAPEAVAQDHDTPSSGTILLFQKVAAERWLHAEHREEIPADADGGQALGFAVGEERRLPRAHEPHALERLAPFSIVDKRREAHVARARIVIPIADDDQTLRFGVRQRPEQHRVDDAENRRVRANTERQGKKRGNREAGRPKQHSDAVSSVLDE
jgi:hypothetical protein